MKKSNMLKMIQAVSYSGMHKWIKEHFGKAKRCENKKCPGKSKVFEWALKKGKRYSRHKKDYKQLCSSCHKRYDYTDERKEKLKATLKGRKITWDTKISETNKKRVWTKEMREKISSDNKLHPHTIKRNSHGQFTKN